MSFSFLFSIDRSYMGVAIPCASFRGPCTSLLNSWFCARTQKWVVLHTPALLFWIFRTLCCSGEWFLRSFWFQGPIAPPAHGFCLRRSPQDGPVRAWGDHFHWRDLDFDGVGCWFWTLAMRRRRPCDWTRPSTWSVCSQTQSASFASYPAHAQTSPWHLWTFDVRSRAWTLSLLGCDPQAALNEGRSTSVWVAESSGDIGIAQASVGLIVVAGDIVIPVVHVNSNRIKIVIANYEATLIVCN